MMKSKKPGKKPTPLAALMRELHVVIRAWPDPTPIAGAEVRMEGWPGNSVTDKNGWVSFLVPAHVERVSFFVSAPGFKPAEVHEFQIQGRSWRSPDDIKTPMDRIVVVPPKPVLVAPVLSIDGKDWKDRGQLYVPRWVSMLSALRPDRSEDDWKRVAENHVETGFNGVRLFAGALTWAGQKAEEARRRLPKFLDTMDTFGLAVNCCALTDSRDGGYDPKEHLREVVAIVRGRKSVAFQLENEVGHGSQLSDLTPDRLRAWGKELCDGLLWSVGSWVDSDEMVLVDPNGPKDGPLHYPTHGGRWIASHLDRGRDDWDQARRVREIVAISEEYGCPALDEEAMGADEVDIPGKRISDPTFFYTLGVLDRAFRGVGGVHHSTAGLQAVLPGPVQQACAEAYVAGHTVINGALAGQVGSYQNTGFQDGPVASIPSDVFERDLVRCYSFLAGDRGATVLIGLRAGASLSPPWKNDWKPKALLEERVRQADGSRIQVLEIAR